MLALNPDKSKLMIMCKNTLRKDTTNIKLQASQYVIEQSEKLKVLGVYFSSGMEQQPNINQIISKVNYRLNILREIFKFCSYRTKIIISNSTLISVFRYAAPLLMEFTSKFTLKMCSPHFRVQIIQVVIK